MKLISMKIPKKSKKEMKEMNEPCGFDQESYPYGLRITFEAEQIKDLPYLSGKKVGDKCMIYAEATVVSTRLSERRGNKSHSVGLQIEKVDAKDVNKKYSKEMTPKQYKEYREQK